jgi:RbsD / FucU transport protein family
MQSKHFGKRAVVVTMARTLILASVCLLPVFAFAQAGTTANTGSHQDWRVRLNQQLQMMGHRNWIAVVDSAYPLQTSNGIETVETNDDQLEVVKTVLNQIAKAKHVRPVIFTDAELKVVPESDAKGVTAYREALSHLLAKDDAQSLPHEEIISKLDEAGKTFHILILKTTLTIPYTSVFIRLDCGYWSADAEKRLREAMAAH